MLVPNTLHHSPQRQLYLFVLAALSISLLVWFTYAPTFQLGFTGWDTVTLVRIARDNLNQSPLAFFTRPLFPGMDLGYYRPLSSLTYGLDYLAWGLNPVGYHLTNVLFHLGVCLGLAVLGYQATHRVIVGWFAALLLALQPLFGTMIANLSYRHDTLMTLGVVWALVFTHAFVRAVGWQRILLQFLGWCCYALALGAKETGLVALPLIAALVLYPYAHPFRQWVKKLVLLLPFALITLGFLIAHNRAVPRFVASPFDISAVQIAIPFDILQSLLAPEISIPLVTWFILALFALCIAVLFYLNRTHRTRLYWLLFCLGWIGLTLLAYILTDVADLAARYSYIVAVPFVLMVSIALLGKLDADSRPQALLGYGAKIITLGILVLWLPTAPILGLEPVWVQRETTANAYLNALDQIVADQPPATTLELENVPAKWLWFDSSQQWLDLRWADKHIQVLKQTSARKPHGEPRLSVTTLDSPQHLRLSAIYLSQED